MTDPERLGDAQQTAIAVLRDALLDHGLETEEPQAGTFVVVVPGERKQRTTVSFVVGQHSLLVEAFVARHVDENAEAVYRWLLERNLRTYGLSFGIDRHGDIYLSGRLPLSAVTAEEVDRLLGSVLENADGSFDTILELGFATAIRREWEWRLSRGESTANLQAFRHLAPPDVASSTVIAPAFVRLAEVPPAGSTSTVLRIGQAVVLLPPDGDDPATWVVSCEQADVLEPTAGGQRGSATFNPGAMARSAGRARLDVTGPDGAIRSVHVTVEPTLASSR